KSDSEGLTNARHYGWTSVALGGGDMKSKVSHRDRKDERDTMRPEYDFSAAVRGATAARYAQGANIVVVDPEVLDVFPDGATVNEVLRALAPVLRHQRRPVAERKQV